ncbi:MAG TPA: TIGR03668 family PPOX class F420-dependent oxidoreductase [Candidatus Limnocylindrales bacterium]|nr:TIGR03668 family PPOX class F420-dependent oxidoreductase [Candidatus Limnocylindrales bacterium]
MTAPELAFVAAARTATLATIAPDDSPRLVPVCFVVAAGDPPVIYTPLDEKPKHIVDVHELARVRDIVARPTVGMLVHRWSEDWAALGWVRLGGRAGLLEPAEDAGEHRAAVADLRAKYPQYASHRLEERPLIRIEIVRVTSWGELG